MRSEGHCENDFKLPVLNAKINKLFSDWHYRLKRRLRIPQIQGVVSVGHICRAASFQNFDLYYIALLFIYIDDTDLTLLLQELPGPSVL